MTHRTNPPRPGFIGVGAIAQALITGWVEHGNFEHPIVISERSKHRSAELAERIDAVSIETDNQAIVDQCDWLFLAVLPDQATEVLGSVKLRPEQVLISLVAGFYIEDLQRLASPATRIHRIIPLPPVEFGMGPLPLFPPDDEIARWMSGCGRVIFAGDERDFTALAAASGLMATHHRLAAVVAQWVEGQGVDPGVASAYGTEMFHALTYLESKCSADSLRQLAAESTTAGGLNEMALDQLEQAGWFAEIPRQLDRIREKLSRLRHDNT